MKYALYVLIAAAIVAAAAGLWHLYRVSSVNKREMAQYAGKSAEVKKDLGKVLVVYYSLTGHTKEIADKIKTLTGADAFRLETAEPLPTGAKLHLAIKEQLKTKKLLLCVVLNFFCCEERRKGFGDGSERKNGQGTDGAPVV